MDRFGARSLDDVLAEVAVPGTDPAAVSEYVNGALVARRRRSRVAGVAAAVLVLVLGGTAFALTGSEEPDEVVAASADPDESEDSGEDSEDSEADSASVVTVVPTTAAPITTVPGIAGLTTLPLAANPYTGSPSGGSAYPVAPDPAPAPAPSTAPAAVPDQPLTGTVSVTDAAAAGEVSRVTVEWSDPDLPPGTVASIELSTGDGDMSLETLTPASGACLGGSGACGSIAVPVRFASATTHTVSAEVSIGGGAPITVISPPVTINAPTVGGAPGRAVVVRVPEGVDPERGTWTFQPEAGDATVRDDGEGTGLRQRIGNAPATVLALPTGQTGKLTHEFGGCVRELVDVDVDSVPGNGLPMGECLPA